MRVRIPKIINMRRTLVVRSVMRLWSFIGLEKMMEAVPTTYRDVKAHLRLVVNGLKELADGRVNSVSSVTLTASSATTVVTDPRVGPNSSIFFEPQTANAATEQAAGGMYVSSKGDQTFTVTHANNAQTDRRFGYAVLGG